MTKFEEIYPKPVQICRTLTDLEKKTFEWQMKFWHMKRRCWLKAIKWVKSPNHLSIKEEIEELEAMEIYDK